MNKVISDYFHRIDKESGHHNSTFAIGGVSCSKDSFVLQNQSLRQAENVIVNKHSNNDIK